MAVRACSRSSRLQFGDTATMTATNTHPTDTVMGYQFVAAFNALAVAHHFTSSRSSSRAIVLLRCSHQLGRVESGTL